MNQLSFRLETTLRQREKPTPEDLHLKEGTDCFFIYNILLDERWHNVIDIMQRRSPTIINWAVRSRISNLNDKLKGTGWFIDSRIGSNRQGEYLLRTDR